MSILLLGILLLYIFYKLADMGDGGASGGDGFDDFVSMNGGSSIARGEDPQDPASQYKSITDPMDLFGGE